SSGRFLMISLTTVSPPTPESKTPIGALLSILILFLSPYSNPWNRLRFFIAAGYLTPVQKSGHRLPYMEQQRPSQHFIHFNLNALRMQGKRKNAAFHDGEPNRRSHRSAPSPGSPPPPHPGL